MTRTAWGRTADGLVVVLTEQQRRWVRWLLTRVGLPPQPMGRGAGWSTALATAAAVDRAAQRPFAGKARELGHVVEVVGDPLYGFVAGYTGLDGAWHGCLGHNHETRPAALGCAETRLQFLAARISRVERGLEVVDG